MRYKNGSVIWLTGLAGSGKSFLAEKICEKLRAEFENVIYLDGDELRELLGHFEYDKKGRLEISYKRAKFAKFLSDQGMIVIVSAISMFDEIYSFNRKNLKNYFEIYVKCDFDELIKRDKKGLYSAALKGEIKNVVGVDIKFDEPKAHFVLDNTNFKQYELKLEEALKAWKNHLK
ncbi:adenylyl-sulfate kinase [Campylobacter sp. MIT 99-7217]|uniref:adenylyl-sulfate kinase n=1 Tax=Campylobacter sp. MIT 99-7217 TaxID=535091 RepID=UPI0011579CC3|nr:adenylyl-sulfate kinase [Campylobacter sp. MIT 99-7217]TQR32965.1 adenylyl-sulfate kinase [Campylobacter sp. MIT 99-7217]